MPTLDKLFKYQQSFIIRWKSAYKLTTTEGVTKNTWRICFAKKGLDKRLFWDKERKMTHQLEIIYAPVYHSEYPDKPLNLIIVRQKTIKGSTNIDYLFIDLDWLLLNS